MYRVYVRDMIRKVMGFDWKFLIVQYVICTNRSS